MLSVVALEAIAVSEDVRVFVARSHLSRMIIKLWNASRHHRFLLYVCPSVGRRKAEGKGPVYIRASKGMY